MCGCRLPACVYVYEGYCAVPPVTCLQRCFQLTLQISLCFAHLSGSNPDSFSFLLPNFFLCISLPLHHIDSTPDFLLKRCQYFSLEDIVFDSVSLDCRQGLIRLCQSTVHREQEFAYKMSTPHFGLLVTSLTSVVAS